VKDALAPEDYIGFGMAFAGFTIIVGSLFLLAKGVITLQAVSTAVKEATPAQGGKDPGKEPTAPAAIAIELGKNIKIQSQYPTLGLFILGIACFFGALYYATQAPPKDSVTLEGHVTGPDKDKYTITIEGAMGVIRPDIHGNVRKIIPKDVEEVDIKLGKAGGTVDTLVVYPATRENGKLSFGEYPTSPQPSTSATGAASPTPFASPQISTSPNRITNQVAATPPDFPTPLFQNQK
jgi:hypothetical protein